MRRGLVQSLRAGGAALCLGLAATGAGCGGKLLPPAGSSLAAWKEHPEHLKAQQRGRDEFFSEYHIQVCQPVREYEFKDQVWKSILS